MNTEIISIPKIERRKYCPGYITGTLQKGHIKAAKYRHSITFPSNVFEDLKNTGVIDIEIWLCDDLCFFEFKDDMVILSFVNWKYLNDFQIRAYHFVLTKAIGFDPFIRTAKSKMNNDRSVNHVVNKYSVTL